MAKKTSKTAKNVKAQTTVNNNVEKPIKQKLIVAQHLYNRWYVYFQGVAPKDNVGCGCKTAKSAIRYMHLLRHRYGAVISQNIYDRLQFEAAKEA